jgi:hypothetical protein
MHKPALCASIFCFALAAFFGIILWINLAGGQPDPRTWRGMGTTGDINGTKLEAPKQSLPPTCEALRYGACKGLTWMTPMETWETLRCEDYNRKRK